MFPKNKKLLWGALIVLVGSGVASFVFLNKRTAIKEINSFEDCAEAGHFVIHSHPQQCKTPDGRIFVEEAEGEKPKPGEVKTYTNPDKVIEVQKGQEFQIALGSNPTTGYTWRVDFATNLISLIDKKFRPTSKLFGAPGTETFTFSTLNKGETEIVFSYLRPWEKEMIEKKVFQVKIL